MQAALALVADLMEHNATCCKEGIDLILRIHLSQSYADGIWNLGPRTVARYYRTCLCHLHAPY